MATLDGYYNGTLRFKITPSQVSRVDGEHALYDGSECIAFGTVEKLKERADARSFVEPTRWVLAGELLK